MDKEILSKAFKDFVILRNQNLDLIKSVDSNAIMTIPDGFNNNLYWHLGHILTVQASLLYARCDIPLPIDDSYFKYFAKGTSPADFDDNIPSLDNLFGEHNDSIEWFKDDFKEYQEEEYDEPLTVSFGHTISSFKDAYLALPYHEAYHLGQIRILKLHI